MTELSKIYTFGIPTAYVFVIFSFHFQDLDLFRYSDLPFGIPSRIGPN